MFLIIGTGSGQNSEVARAIATNRAPRYSSSCRSCLRKQQQKLQLQPVSAS